MSVIARTGVVIPLADTVVASRKSIRLHRPVGEGRRQQQGGKTKPQIGRSHALEDFSQVHGVSLDSNLPRRYGVFTPSWVPEKEPVGAGGSSTGRWETLPLLLDGV